MKRILLSAVCVGASMGLVFSLNTSASSAERAVTPNRMAAMPQGYESWKEVYSVQEFLTKQVNQIEDGVAHLGNSGYSGAKINFEKREVDVYWKGKPSSAARMIFDNAAGRYPIVVRSSEYSRKELTPVAKEFLSTTKNSRLKLADGTSITEQEAAFVSVNEDGSGITVGVLKGKGLQKTQSAASRSGRGALISEDGRTVDVDITVEGNADSAKPQNASRYSTPSTGGAVINMASNDNCSTGFGVTQNGSRFMLTARHCGATGAAVYYADPQRTPLGTVTNSNTAQDIAIFSISNGSQPDRRKWTGTSFNQNSSNGAAHNVTGFGNPAVNGFVYTDGAYLGTSGSNQVQSSQYYYNLEGNVVGPLYLASNTAGAPASASGNSGGPVYQYTSGSGITATGIISGGSYIVPCPAGVIASSCTSRVFFSGASRTAETLGLSGF
ncbi:S1 family peptidase [Streptomyces sp. NBC_01275]|uniref:trypsin-like serine protease n=1 Tax=Streptomyces sp. NBC_01275 TaxID=2903807 RepID=UPI00225AEABD|nr:trypsin-like serine protease [Streptomyces sp. NBC_01275]MCX4760401.1 S1 family peptidase [Streptomyces sp. NBC_01275]